MNHYLNMLEYILEYGTERTDRTGVGTIGVFGYQFRHDLSKGFPLLTTKKVHTKSIIHELLWFLSGSTNIKYLKDNGVSIWNEWADENGELGPVYGSQWRNWRGDVISADPEFISRTITNDSDKLNGVVNINYKYHDQISDVIENLKNDPFSRRHIVSAWNVSDINKMALPPCHAFFQFNVRTKRNSDTKYLDCHLYQRKHACAFAA